MKTIFSILILFVTWSSYAQSAKVKINDDITVLLPNEFRPMSDEELVTKFFSARKPIAAYTNYDRTVDFSVNETVTSWQNEDLPLMKSFYKSNIHNLYNEVQFLNEGIEEINERDFAFFEFISVVKDDESSFNKKGNILKYTYIQYTLKDGKTVLFHFSCPERDKEDWKPVASGIMKSVKIK
ncbi:hypothetical protein QQ008_09870 [Fulvivirgaceae bacterium BMA10]|uniref:Uncharacterized protein n=1 Tax=Splendidivirga corallicola TaxID=3051826 RepID=A0ABT8KLS1_9BACT|nr:hypothetical protein [Fulvivirgaceae bacterium BMA10]